MTNNNRDFTPDEFLWIHAGPSRRLRKLHAEAEAIQRKMDEVRASNPFPGHAPTACRIISRRLRELRRELERVERRILRLPPEDGLR